MAGMKAFVSYRETIRHAVSQSNLFLAVIGPRFDVRRLHEPASVIAFEWQLARSHRVAVIPVLVEHAGEPGHGEVVSASAQLATRMPDANDLPAELRWFTRVNACSLRTATLPADVDRLIAEVPALATAPRRPARVLWVDDNPANNETERALLRKDGIVFDNVVSTAEAIEQLKNESYDLVITDLGRRQSSDGSSTAGASFIDQAALRDGGPPVIVYASAWGLRHEADLRRRGAKVVTDDFQQLIESVRLILGRTDGAAAQLQR